MTHYSSIDVVLRWIGGADIHLTSCDAQVAVELLNDLNLAYNGTEQSVPLRDGWRAVALCGRREVDEAQLNRWADQDAAFMAAPMSGVCSCGCDDPKPFDPYDTGI